MQHILFVDFNSDIPYCPDILSKIGLGGTEATVIRIAEELSHTAKITVAQEARKAGDISKANATYISWDTLNQATTKFDFDTIVLLRRPELMKMVAKIFPNTRKLIWMHDLPGKRFGRYLFQLKKYSFEMITVSNYQCKLFVDSIKSSRDLLAKISYFLTRSYLPKITTIYNPLAPYIKKQDTAIDPYKLVFLSNPRKGLKEVISVFKKIRKINPKFTLYISRPSYSSLDFDIPKNSGLINLGKLSHQEILNEVSSAFCVFLPQYSIPETFGLVYAEANALGTPVISYDFGAAKEILSSDEQIIPIFDEQAVIDRLFKWEKYGRPNIIGQNEFKLENIVRKWKKQLNL